MIGHQCGIGGAAGQCDLSAVCINDVTINSVALEDTAHVADVVHQAGDDQVCVVAWRRLGEQRAPDKNVMSGKRHQHGVFDVVIKRIAVGNALERELGRERDQLGQAGMRRPASPVHFGREEFS